MESLLPPTSYGNFMVYDRIDPDCWWGQSNDYAPVAANLSDDHRSSRDSYIIISTAYQKYLLLTSVYSYNDSSDIPADRGLSDDATVIVVIIIIIIFSAFIAAAAADDNSLSHDHRTNQIESQYDDDDDDDDDSSIIR